MSHQINFYAFPDDLRQLEQEMRKAGDFVFVRSHSSGPSPIICGELSAERDPWLYWYLMRPGDLQGLPEASKTELGTWALPPTAEVLAIEYHLPSLKGPILRSGRLYYVTEDQAPFEPATPRDPDFVQWADRVVRRARAFFVRHDGMYVGPSVPSWLQATEGADLV
jgi:hypothetical protein